MITNKNKGFETYKSCQFPHFHVSWITSFNLFDFRYWFSCILDYNFQLVWFLILDFHVPWITSFNLFYLWYFNFMYLWLQVSTCMVFLLHSEDINLFVYTLNRKFQLVSWLFTKSKSADYFQKLWFFFQFQIQLNIKISKLAEL